MFRVRRNEDTCTSGYDTDMCLVHLYRKIDMDRASERQPLSISYVYGIMSVGIKWKCCTKEHCFPAKYIRRVWQITRTYIEFSLIFYSGPYEIEWKQTM